MHAPAPCASQHEAARAVTAVEVAREVARARGVNESAGGRGRAEMGRVDAIRAPRAY